MIWVLYGWRRELEGEIKIFIPHPKLVLYTIQGYVGDNASMTVRAMSEMVMDQTKSTMYKNFQNTKLLLLHLRNPKEETLPSCMVASLSRGLTFLEPCSWPYCLWLDESWRDLLVSLRSHLLFSVG